MSLDHGVILALAEHKVQQVRIAQLLSPLKVFRSSGLSKAPHHVPYDVVVILSPKVLSTYGRETCFEVRCQGQEGRGILVTEFDPENARALPGIWTGEVIWIHSLESELSEKVERLQAEGLERRVLDQLFSLCDGPNELLRQGLRTAFLAVIPPQTQRELVSNVGVSDKSFRRTWREAGFPGRSEAAIDWSLLTRVVSARMGGWSLDRACYRIGVEPWRIQRAAKRRVGVSAGKVDEKRLVEALKAWIAQR